MSTQKNTLSEAKDWRSSEEIQLALTLQEKPAKEKLARTIDKNTPLCWADLVMWFSGYKNFQVVLDEEGHVDCAKESAKHMNNFCYCGKYYKGYNTRSRELPEQIKQELREIKKEIQEKLKEEDLPYNNQ